MTDPTCPRTFVLRDLPLAARLTLALFLMSVGIGYFSALVNLHFQSASPGEPMPTDEDVVRDYHGKSNMSQLERLLTAHPNLPFNGQGSMRSAFTKRKASGWKTAVKNKAKEMSKDRDQPLDPDKAADLVAIEKEVQRDLDGERLAVIGWVRDGTKKDAYEDNHFPLTGNLAKLPITPKFVEEENGQRFAKVKSIIDARCVRCHSESAGGAGSEFPLDTFEEIVGYTTSEGPTGKSLTKLALTTHVHLLGFAMLYGLTGLVLAFSSYPRALRVVLCPLPLLAQLVDIAFWWLARLEAPQGPQFAQAIRISGGVVGGALFLQIVLGLWNLFGKTGKTVLILLALSALGGGYLLHKGIINPYLLQEAGHLLEHKD
jgi:hypothetical protein